MATLGKGLQHLIAVIAVAVVAFSTGRWLRDPDPGPPLLALLGVMTVIAVALRQLYRAPPAGAPRAAEPVRVVANPAAPAAVHTSGLLDINEAAEAELTTLPGVGPALARRIVETRPFASVAELSRIAGFGPSRIKAVEALVTVSERDRAGASLWSAGPAGPREPA